MHGVRYMEKGVKHALKHEYVSRVMSKKNETACEAVVVAEN